MYSLALPGFGQIHNKDYWKIPVSYAGIGGFAYLGSFYNKRYKSNLIRYEKYLDDPNVDLNLILPYKQNAIDYKAKRNVAYTAMGAFLWATTMDAVLNYPGEIHSAAKATIYSTMLPGLGQIYNKKYWKVPVVYALLGGSFYAMQSMNYEYSRYLEAAKILKANPNADVNVGGLTDYERIINRKDYYRRNRDISMLVFGLSYVLQVLDANVDANMIDYDISDDLSFNIKPSIVSFDQPLFAAYKPIGLGLQITF